MQPIPQSLFPRLANDKILDRPQLVFTSLFESPGVVENISTVVREHQFILNIVNATLLTIFS